MTNIPAYSKMLALDQSSSINVRRRNLRFANHERKSKEMAFVFHINWKAKTLINGQIQPFRVLIISSIISFELQAALVILIGLYFFQCSQKEMFPGLRPKGLAYFQQIFQEANLVSLWLIHPLLSLMYMLAQLCLLLP